MKDLLLVLAIVFSFIWGIAALRYRIDQVPVRVYVEDKLVYSGRSACVDVKSTGATTRVDVLGGPYCLLPKAYYVSQDVRLESN